MSFELHIQKADNKQKMRRGAFMENLIHPVSGEKGFFCSISEKNLIDVILVDFKNRHLVVTSQDERGVNNE